jgi:hypothetical protein
MGMLDCVKQIRAFKASQDVRETILGRTAATLLGQDQGQAKRAARG